MARKNPVPEREKEICRRLLEFRMGTQLTRAALAKQLYITAIRLKSYERGAVPLPYTIAQALASRFGVSYQWLAEGVGPKTDSATELPGLKVETKPKALFSEVYDAMLKPSIKEASGFLDAFGTGAKAKLSAAGIVVEELPIIGAPGSGSIHVVISKLVGVILQKLPPHLVWPFYRHLVQAASRFEADHDGEIESWTEIKTESPGQGSGKSQKEVLTTVIEYDNSIRVPSKLVQLIERLKKATARYGSKAELARYIGVQMPQVSEWLAGRREPGGENTLLLLEWVRAKESKQQKSPGSAINTARAKTRSKPKNEKPESNPP